MDLTVQLNAVENSARDGFGYIIGANPIASCAINLGIIVTDTVPPPARVCKVAQALVTRIESGDLPLEQALQEFEHGVKLTRQCQTALQEAEQKVEILLKKTVAAEPSPFSDPGADD